MLIFHFSVLLCPLYHLTKADSLISLEFSVWARWGVYAAFLHLSLNSQNFYTSSVQTQMFLSFVFFSLRVHLTCKPVGAVTYFCKAGIKSLLALILLTSNLPRLCRCLKGSGMPRTHSGSRRAASDTQHLDSLPWFEASKFICISHCWE